MSDPDEAEPWPHEPTQDVEPDVGEEHEPEEFDPTDLGPTAPEAPSPADVQNPEAVALFWKLVVVFNAALLGLSIGPMIGFFLGDWSLGLAVFVAGGGFFLYGLARYYEFHTDDERNE